MGDVINLLWLDWVGIVTVECQSFISTPTYHVPHAEARALAVLQMEGMINDLQLARDGQQAFEDWHSRQVGTGVIAAGGHAAFTISIDVSNCPESSPSFRTLTAGLPAYQPALVGCQVKL